MTTLEVQVFNIEKDGLPDFDNLIGRIAFIWDGNIMNGWPLLDQDPTGHTWEGNSDFARHEGYSPIRHYLVFPAPLHSLK